jgi:hypothetical protein
VNICKAGPAGAHKQPHDDVDHQEDVDQAHDAGSIGDELAELERLSRSLEFIPTRRPPARLR